MDMTREAFVHAYGHGARARELAAVLGITPEEAVAIRARVRCQPRRKALRFAELFALWHGRPPRDDEWPAPGMAGGRGRHSYEWLPPETALLISLVGTMSKAQILKIINRRLVKITGDRKHLRTLHSIQNRINRIGLQAGDVLGGITVREAAAEIGSRPPVYQAIRRRELHAFKVGRIVVIQREAWEAWKAKHTFPPPGYVPLAPLKQPLGIRSDKLSEYARMGYVPTAVRCNPYGQNVRSTAFGTWWIDAKVARKLIADRRAGRPMPWWGKPYEHNLEITWALLQKRRHPEHCDKCRTIWGRQGPPETFEDYARRYPPLDHGAKRHLTMRWTPGMTLLEVQAYTQRTRSQVLTAIGNGTLSAYRHGRCLYVHRSDATHWKARGCPSGIRAVSWVSLSTAGRQHGFTMRELRRLIREGKLRTKVGTDGEARGVVYVPKHQVRHLREKLGFTEQEAARRIGISVARFRRLAAGVNWRGAKGIPLDTVNAIAKRLKTNDEGMSIAQAAKRLRVTAGWIHQRILDGTARIKRGKFDPRRLYITRPMFARLRRAKRHPLRRHRFGPHWLLLSQAASDAGVSASTILKWYQEGALTRKPSPIGYRYLRSTVRRRARHYWKNCKWHRAVPPTWFNKGAQR